MEWNVPEDAMHCGNMGVASDDSYARLCRDSDLIPNKKGQSSLWAWTGCGHCGRERELQGVSPEVAGGEEKAT